MTEVWWVGLVPMGFLIVGLLFALIGYRGWRAQGDFDRRATARTVAVVTDIRYEHRGSGSSRSTIAIPVVSFGLPDGRTVSTEAMAVDHPGARWKRQGIEVPIVYDPSDPASVAIEGATSGGRLLYAFFVAFGGFFALIGGLGVALSLWAYLAFGG